MQVGKLQVQAGILAVEGNLPAAAGTLAEGIPPGHRVGTHDRRCLLPLLSRDLTVQIVDQVGKC